MTPIPLRDGLSAASAMLFTAERDRIGFQEEEHRRNDPSRHLHIAYDDLLPEYIRLLFP